MEQCKLNDYIVPDKEQPTLTKNNNGGKRQNAKYPVKFSSPKLNSDEETAVSCLQDKAQLRVFPYESIYLVAE